MPPESEGLAADLERLRDIGDQVLAGTPIEDFELGEYEIHVVIGYCKTAVDDVFPDWMQTDAT